MGKKKIPFLFKPPAAAAISWPWPGCANNPKTLSFREQESFSFESETEEAAVISGLRSERLIFEPGETNSILEEAKTESPYKETAAIKVIDSRNPFYDFRVSMEEMVEAHGIKEWKFLEELLAWYLRANGRSNHGYIVAAFVDLVINLALASGSCDSSGSDIDENCSSSSTTTQYSLTSSSLSSFV